MSISSRKCTVVVENWKQTQYQQEHSERERKFRQGRNLNRKWSRI